MGNAISVLPRLLIKSFRYIFGAGRHHRIEDGRQLEMGSRLSRIVPDESQLEMTGVSTIYPEDSRSTRMEEYRPARICYVPNESPNHWFQCKQCKNFIARECEYVYKPKTGVAPYEVFGDVINVSIGVASFSLRVGDYDFEAMNVRCCHCSERLGYRLISMLPKTCCCKCINGKFLLDKNLMQIERE